MSNILIPVDFSIACYNAYSFGLQLAKRLNVGVILSHYYGGSFSPNRPLLLGRNTSIKDGYLQRLESFAKCDIEGNESTMLADSGVKVAYEAEVALSPSAAVLHRANEADIDLIIMATRSTVNVADRWLGSNSTTVSESAPKPVFLIPPQVTYKEFERIVIANHHETAEPYPLWQINILAQLTGAKMHFVSVENLDEPDHVKFVPWKLMDELAKQENDNYEIVTVDEDDITAGLLDYAGDINAQLLVIVNRLRSHWRSVLHPSLTQHIALRTDIPLLVLHTNE